MTNFKLTLFVLSLLLISSSDLSAQSGNMSIGFEAGPTYTFVRGNTIVEDLESPTYSFSAAGTYGIQFTNWLALHTALGFEKKGTKGDILFTNANGDQIGQSTYRSTFSYITLPVLARFSVGQKTKFYFNAGPYFGLLVKQMFTSKSSSWLPAISQDNTDDFKVLDIGVSAGIGALIPINEQLRLSFELRNNLGLRDINPYALTSDWPYKTNSTALLIGLNYSFIKK